MKMSIFIEIDNTNGLIVNSSTLPMQLKFGLI